MRKNYILAFLLGLSICLLFGYTRSWTESTPTDATVANQIDDFNRYLRVDVAERIEDYIGGFNASDSNEGFYHILFLENATSLSTPAANKYLLYGLLADGKCELVGEDEDGDMIQLSYTGKHMIGSGTAPQAFMYNTTEEDGDGGRESTIRAKGEDSDGTVKTLGYIEFAHDGTSKDQKGRFRIMLNDGDDDDAPSKCPIEYASDGTIDVTNSVSVLDEDNMASDSATKVSTQQSIKKYVDDMQTLRCRMYLGSDQSVNTGSETVVAFDTETYDDDSIGTTGAAAKITPGVAGYYLVSLGVKITDLGDGKFAYLRLYKNTGIVNHFGVNSGVTSGTSLLITDVIYLDADDYIQAKITHNNGSARNITGDDVSTWMTLQRVGG